MLDKLEPIRARDKNLVNNWYIACLYSEIKNKPIQRIIYDQKIVLFKNDEGIFALEDRCLHRNALLSDGKIIENHITCPYHGWSYDSCGFLASVPSENKLRKKSGMHCLKSYPIKIQDDCVWIWMGDSPPLKEQRPYKFPYWNEDSWSGYFMVTDFENEVTNLAENFMDVPHTVFVHETIFRKKKMMRVPFDIEVNNGNVLVTYKEQKDEIGISGRILNPTNEPLTHTDLFILPNITRVDYNYNNKSHFIINSQCTPVTTMKSRVYTAIIYRIPFVAQIYKPFLKKYTRAVIQQDVDIMKNQSQNLINNPNPQFQSTEADIVHLWIEKLRDLHKNNDPKAFEINYKNSKEFWI